MSFAIRGELTGLRDVLRRLAKLANQTTRSKILRKALEAATKPMLDAARALVPRDTGLLRKSLGRRTKTYRSSGVVMVIIGPRSGYVKDKKTGRRLTAFGKKMVSMGKQRPTKYAHLVEFGTGPHAVGKGSSLRKKKQGGGMHPGARAKPFLRPAFERCQAGALATMKRLILEGIAKESK